MQRLNDVCIVEWHELLIHFLFHIVCSRLVLIIAISQTISMRMLFCFFPIVFLSKLEKYEFYETVFFLLGFLFLLIKVVNAENVKSIECCKVNIERKVHTGIWLYSYHLDRRHGMYDGLFNRLLKCDRRKLKCNPVL